MSEVPQIRRLAFNDEEIGMGFNSQTGLAVGTALEDFIVQENPAAPGAEVASCISIVSTHEELQESLGMSFEAQGRFGLVAGSAKAKFSEQTNYNSMSTFVIASIVVENPLKRGKKFKITPDAKALLDSNRTEEFKKAFGDSFVRGLQTGGEFYAVVRITSVSASTQTELSASLQAEYNGLVTAGSFKAEFEKTKNSSQSRSEFTATMYQRAGAGPTISPTVTIDEVITRFKKFPEIAAASASAYETEVATYDTIPLPIPTPIEQEAFLEALADARDKKLRYIQTRNDLEFALRFPDFFETLPTADVITNASSVYTKLMNAVTQHAIKLSKGQINPPQFFDPSLLSPPLAEPALIWLKKKDLSDQPLIGPDGSIKVPTFIGFDTFDLEYVLRAVDFTDSIDEILAGNVPATNPPIESPVTLSREAIAFCMLTTSMNGQKIKLETNRTPTSHFQKHIIVAQQPLPNATVLPGGTVKLTIQPAS